ncbi:unnamed protein product [Ceutorhynchus assimilis]|uniref:DUF4806 domain-containing protein n=1 Tax=Ceutorhynchus assimilis TaxID=467358 RepID=A0A9N9MZF8_9CUCU|nr:unnamed protein product [Ceutorhynchus assimilis]
MSASAFKRIISDKYYRRHKRLYSKFESRTIPCAFYDASRAPSGSSEITDHPQPYPAYTNDESFNSGIDTDSSTDYASDSGETEGLVNFSPISKPMPEPTCEPESFSNKLAKWALQFNIAHNALGDLLRLLIEQGIEMPKDPRTLLKTPRETDGSILSVVEPGHYIHFGFQKSLLKLLNVFNRKNSKHFEYNTIRLCVNIDGLPISKSSGNQIWPIMINIMDNKDYVEIVGIYQGNAKPSDSNSFLNEFVDEANDILANGLIYLNKTYTTKLLFVCDVPAKSFIKCTRGHSGYMSCSKCNVEGVFQSGDYSTARSKARKAEVTSDLNSDDGKNKRQRKKKFMSSSESESEDNRVLSQFRKKLPTPPKKKSRLSLEVSRPTSNTLTLVDANVTTEISESQPRGQPSATSSSNSSCNNLCTHCCTKNSKNKDNKTTLFVIKDICCDILAKVEKLQTSEPVNPIPGNLLNQVGIDFPMTTMEELSIFEEFFKNEEKYTVLVRMFSKMGGSTTGDFIRRCLAPIISNELAMKFSFIGRKGKENLVLSAYPRQL